MNEGFSTPCASPEHKPHVVLLFLCFIIEGELGVGRDDSNLPQVPVGDNAINFPSDNCLGILVCVYTTLARLSRCSDFNQSLHALSRLSRWPGLT